MASKADRFHGASFILGAVNRAGMPSDDGAEVAFAGRSNAGKSSAINALTGSRALARISKAPGRTREINFFLLPDGGRLVDLPGYGFARVPEAMKAAWAAQVSGYLHERDCLRGVVQVMDVRRPFTELDCRLTEWCAAAALPVHALLTKSDKLPRGQAAEALFAARRQAAAFPQVSVQLFSALKRQGIDELAEVLLLWLAQDETNPGPEAEFRDRGEPGPGG